MGTPNYMSPEQVRGEKADARSDIFSLGAVFYELLTSHKAFDADSIHAVLFQVLEHDPQPMRNWAGDVPEILVEVVRRALDKDPVRRFQDAGQLREAVHVARQVFSGEIDEEAGLAALHEVGSAEATVIGLATGGEATVITADPAAPPADISTDATRARKAASIVKGRTTSRPGSSRTGRPVTSRPASRAPAVPAPAPRASRLPLFLGAGVLVLALLAVAAVVFLRPAPAPAPTAPPANVTDPLMVDALVGSLVELANQDLRNKNYASAVKRADSILGLRKDNTEARDIRNLAQGKLDELHAAAQEARQAFEAGDAAKASQFLATVMSIDPSDAVVDELSQKLNRFFQAKAEDARSEMGRSRAAAETAGAARQADFADAVEGARKAEALFKNREYAVATSRYLEASNRFERARNAQVRPTPRPTAVVVAPTLAPAPPTLAPMPPPVVPTAAPAPVTVPSAPPATLALGDEPAIRKVIDDYRRAIESKNLELFRSVKPSLSAAEEKSLRELFKMPQRQQLNLSVEAVDINGAQARVRTSRQDAIDGRQQKKVQQTFNLTKAASGWVIRDWTISQ